MRTMLKLLSVGSRTISRILTDTNRRNHSVKLRVFLHHIKTCRSNL
nr:MAG TPA: hypothetical protein [Caudoviricetes sp.]